jgi:hypothetical protein
MSSTTDASYGGTPARGVGRVGARRTFTETKNGFKTSEFLMMLVFVVAVLVAAYADGEDSLGHKEGWLFAAVAAGAYIVSRGLAKLGVREPYTEEE